MLVFYTMAVAGGLIFLSSSTHSLSYLLLVEAMVLVSILTSMVHTTSWFTCLMLLLVSVCVGVYGISLFVSLSRSKGFSLFFSL